MTVQNRGIQPGRGTHHAYAHQRLLEEDAIEANDAVVFARGERCHLGCDLRRLLLCGRKDLEDALHRTHLAICLARHVNVRVATRPEKLQQSDAVDRRRCRF